MMKFSKTGLQEKNDGENENRTYQTYHLWHAKPALVYLLTGANTEYEILEISMLYQQSINKLIRDASKIKLEPDSFVLCF